ncbi:MAG: phosphoribosylformylglycinamidine synthase [Spirochaetae bacterium HGW-Spirochaetae-5]|nr:MAG: phosphoribosylformylglycinamidine synthase [Spirochaetae bacterium HGW-Spirochaetae-5]
MPQPNTAKFRIEVFYKKSDPRGIAVRDKFISLGYSIKNVYLADNYLIDIDVDEKKIKSAAETLVQPVTQSYSINKPYNPENFDYCIEIGFLPGVTDNISHTVRESLEDFFKKKFDEEKSVFYTTSYFFKGEFDKDIIASIGKELYNPLIQRIKIYSKEQYASNNGMGFEIPVVHISESSGVDSVDLNLDDEALQLLGREGIANSDGTRRGPLALDMISMNVIKEYFHNEEKREPTDIELESIAQTWSEHCKHTIFAAAIDDDTPGGIYKSYIREATARIRKEKGDKDFCVSVFTDNSGGIDFDDDYIISDKVETHNSPSALDPFGGAITGIVGVNRDSIGFGMGAKPVANRFGFCFADPEDEVPVYKNKSEDSKLLSPRRIMEGVVHGVNAGGNTSGIPTPQGFIYFDEKYKGKPLVFVGTIGLMPKKTAGRSSVEKSALPGDNIIIVGGRVGRDGIHGATFSSEALSSGSPATAVQIGDPITQKKLSDAIVKEARDAGLYNSITDNGAGGLSCSVAEMAKECGGFVVDLENIPLKYHGLSPWQIWVSESQERMTLSVPDNKKDEFITLMNKRGVEATVIGKFTSSGRGIVNHKGKEIFNLKLDFLHDGLPKRNLFTEKNDSPVKFAVFREPEDHNEVFHKMISRLNVCSFEYISSQYDHEVQGNSVTKPLQGKGRVNSNVSVIRPLLSSSKGVVISQGLYPSYSEIDPYWMAACSIDTAVRNAISAGGSIDHLAILDNFCWCDSNNPFRLWQLKQAAKACYDFAVAYGTPYISGKDSMFNDFKGYDENFNEINISIPPTLLISSIGVMNDITKAVTIDFKIPGDLIYIIGNTGDETGGSEYNAFMGEKEQSEKFIGTNIPRVNAELSKKIYKAMETAINERLAASCISIERGGFAIAAAKSAAAGILGCEIKLSGIKDNDVQRNDILLYSESQGRFLVSVNPSNRDKFENIFKDLPCHLLGNVKKESSFIIEGISGKKIIDTDIREIDYNYKKKLKKY